jgi:hypothetical protein
MRTASTKFDAPLADLNRETATRYAQINCKLMCTHRGPLTPMIEVEAHLLKVMLLRGTMRLPVSCAEGLELANSLIEGTVSQFQLVEWKYQHPSKNFREDKATTLGQKYWRNLCRRHSREIESKKAVRYDSKRDDWCTLLNFKRMHDDIYAAMVRGGVAKELDYLVYHDRERNTLC